MNFFRLNLRFAGWLLLLAGLMLPGGGAAQENLMNRKISLQFDKLELQLALDRIADAAGIHFSYNADILDGKKKVAQHCTNRKLGKVLREILGSGYSYRSHGNYLIILQDKIPETAPSSESKTSITLLNISGQVSDHRSSKPLGKATIYEMSGLESALSDSSGQFRMQVKPRTSTLALRCNKQHYSDTVILFKPDSLFFLIIRLKPLPQSIPALHPKHASELQAFDTLPLRITGRVIPEEWLLNSNNISIPEIRWAQLSLVPTIGTNRKLSGSVVNNFSINILGGFSRGVKGFEAGGVFNVTHSYVKGVQIAGAANIGGDTVKGIQMAGLFNYCSRQLKGVQVAGLGNIARGRGSVVQFGGILNYSPDPAFQFGLINIADTNSGMALGVINIIRKGYYGISLNTDDIGFSHFHIHSGTHSLYTISGMAAKLSADSVFWGIELGFGSHLFHRSVVGLDLEFLSTVLNIHQAFDETTTTRLSLSAQMSIRILPALRLTAGPSANVFIAGRNNPEVSRFIDLTAPARRQYYESTRTRYDLWPGWTASLKIQF